MIICDSCKAQDKVTQAYNSFAIVAKRTHPSPDDIAHEEIHLCFECEKTLSSLISALRYVIRRKGMTYAVNAQYAFQKEIEPEKKK